MGRVFFCVRRMGTRPASCRTSRALRLCSIRGKLHFFADNAGGVVKGVRTQIGVVNARDGGEYGISLIAENGRNAAALRVQQNNSAIWNDAFQIVNASGSIIARIRAADGAISDHWATGQRRWGWAERLLQGTSRTTSVALNTLNGEIPSSRP